MFRPQLSFAALAAAALLAGCSGAGTAVHPHSGPQSLDVLGPPIGDTSGMVEAALAAWTLEVDRDTLSATVAPVRTASATSFGQGDNYLLSVRPFMKGDEVAVRGVSLDPGGNIRLKLGVKHPFAAPADLNRPATAAKRIDLHIFETHLLLVADGTDTFFASDNPVTLNHDLVTNADGYRSPGPLFDAVALGAATADTFPYVMVGDYDSLDPDGNYDAANDGWQGANLLAPTGYGVFPMGADKTVDMVLDIGAGSLELNLVLLCKYQDPRGGTGAIQKRANRLPDPTDPTLCRYLLPQGAGDLESVSVNIAGPVPDNDPLTPAAIDGEILDWDQDATVIAPTAWPDDADLSKIPEPSSPADAVADVPDLDGAATFPLAITGNPGGATADYSGAIYNTDSFAVTGADVEVPGLMRVRDTQDDDDTSATGVVQQVLGETSVVPLPGTQPLVPTVRYQTFNVTVFDAPPPVPQFNFTPVSGDTPVTAPAQIPDNTAIAWSMFDYKNNVAANAAGSMYAFYRRSTAPYTWYMSRCPAGATTWGPAVTMPNPYLSSLTTDASLTMNMSCILQGEPIIMATDNPTTSNHLTYMDGLNFGPDSTRWFAAAYGENLGTANWRHGGITGDPTVAGITRAYMCAFNQTTNTLSYWQLDFSNLITTTSTLKGTIYSGSCDDVTMVCDLAGDLHVIYRHGPNGIYYKKITNPSSVTPTIGPEVNVSQNGANNVVNGQIFIRPSTNEAMIAWEQWNGGSDEDIYIARGNLAGTSFTMPYAICATPVGPHQTYPDLIVGVSDKLVVSWEEKIGANPKKIVGTCVMAGAFGTVVVPESAISPTSATDDAEMARLVLDVSGASRFAAIYRRSGQPQALRTRWFTVP